MRSGLCRPGDASDDFTEMGFGAYLVAYEALAFGLLAGIGIGYCCKLSGPDGFGSGS
jgi:hypothetical protein